MANDAGQAVPTTRPQPHGPDMAHAGVFNHLLEQLPFLHADGCQKVYDSLLVGLRITLQPECQELTAHTASTLTTSNLKVLGGLHQP